jgi:hypothetical protein
VKAVNGIILINLLLNIVCLYFIYLLWKKIDQNNMKNETESTENIEELLELFSQEMREENERLHRLITDFSGNYVHDDLISHEKAFISDSDKVNVAEMIEDENEGHNDFVESKKNSETENVIMLAKQGYNAEEIAKKINRGKGEIELLLKFYA